MGRKRRRSKGKRKKRKGEVREDGRKVGGEEGKVMGRG